jgi:YHS domain-containing protein
MNEQLTCALCSASVSPTSNDLYRHLGKDFCSESCLVTYKQNNVCAQCGVILDPKVSKSAIENKGSFLYFCSTECQNEFSSQNRTIPKDVQVIQPRRSFLKKATIAGLVGLGLFSVGDFAGFRTAKAAVQPPTSNQPTSVDSGYGMTQDYSAIVFLDTNGAAYVKEGNSGQLLVLMNNTTQAYANLVSGGSAGKATSTSGIQEALNYANTQGGGRIFVKAGNYPTSVPIQIPQKVILEGDGTGVDDAATVIQITSSFPSGGSVIECWQSGLGPNSISGIGIKHLTVSSANTSTSVIGVNLTGWNHSFIEDVHVFNGGGSPVSGSIGFAFSDDTNVKSGGGTSTSCFFNRVERVDVSGSYYGFYLTQKHGNDGVNSISDFTTSNVMIGIHADFVDDIGFLFQTGYLYSGIGGSTAFDISAYQGAPMYQSTLLNVSAEGFTNMTSSGTVYPPFNVNQNFSVAGTLEHFRNQRWFGQSTNLGGSYSPSNALAVNNSGPGPQCNGSCWAKIPSGTALSAGVNNFRFYLQDAQPPSGMAEYFHHVEYSGGGLAQPVNIVITVTANTGGAYTLNIALIVANAVSGLPSDLVFAILHDFSQPG